MCAFVRAKEETLWLAKLAQSLQEATADGLLGFISAAIRKPTNANITTEQFMVESGKRKRTCLPRLTVLRNEGALFRCAQLRFHRIDIMNDNASALHRNQAF